MPQKKRGHGRSRNDTCFVLNNDQGKKLFYRIAIELKHLFENNINEYDIKW